MSRIAREPEPETGGAALPFIRDGAVVFDRPSIPGTAGLGASRPYVLVSGEQVLAIPVELPLASHRQRLEAVGFAVEGLIAEPLSKVHVALGPQIAPKRYLAVVAAHAAMGEWNRILKASGLSQARVLPDFLALPSVIADGWTVFASEDRALVRRSDLSGFSTLLSTLPAAWRLAGCPPVASCGDPLPGLFMAERVTIAAPLAADAVAATFTLTQGPYAASAFRGSGFLRRAGLICAVGLTVLGAINLADTIALHALAEDRRVAAQAEISRVAPDTNPAQDIEAQLARILPDAEADHPGRFLPLFADVATALAPQAGELTIESLAYDAADGQLGVEVTAQDLAALQRIEAALVDSGLRASSGVATAEKGGAKVRIVVADAGAPEGS